MAKLPRAGVLLLSASLLLAVGFVTSRIRNGSRPTSPAWRDVDVDIGDRLCVPIGNSQAVGSSPLILVLFTSSTCGVCAANRTVEEDIIGAAKTRGVAVKIVIAPGKENDSLTRHYQARNLPIIRDFPGRIGVSRVPSVYVIDPESRIVSRWIGSVPEEKRASIVDDLLAKAPLQRFSRIDRHEFEQALRSSTPFQVLALSPRAISSAGLDRYVVIPLGELLIRAEYELRRDLPVYVDCATSKDPGQCQSAAFELAVMNFPRVSAVGLPRRRGGCQSSEAKPNP